MDFLYKFMLHIVRTHPNWLRVKTLTIGSDALDLLYLMMKASTAC